METITTSLQAPPIVLSCSDQGSDHGYCAPVSTTVYDRSVNSPNVSISITTTTATEASTRTAYPTYWIQPQLGGSSDERTKRTLLIVLPIVGGVVLVGVVIWVWRWRVLKKRRGYPGWRVMGMLKQPERRAPASGEAVVAQRSDRNHETDMAARSSREELERITAANARAPPVAVGSIDSVVHGNAGAKEQGTGGNGNGKGKGKGKAASEP